MVRDAKFLHADNEDADQTMQTCRLLESFLDTRQKVHFLMLWLNVLLHPRDFC